FCERVRASGQVGPARQRLFHPCEEFLVMRQRLPDVRRIEPVIDHVTFVFCAPRDGRFEKFGVRIMHEWCRYSSISLLNMWTRARLLGAAGISGGSGNASSR